MYAQNLAYLNNNRDSGLETYRYAIKINGRSAELWNSFTYWTQNKYPDRPDIIK